MAKVDIKMPDEFLERMSRLGKDFDAVAESVLEAGGEVVLQKVQSNLSAVVGSGTKYESRSTGELESALGLTPAKTDKDGNNAVEITDQTIIDQIASSVSRIEFSLVAPAG